MSNMVSCYHVTNREAAEAIISDGFMAGWGDDGFGVYLFSDLSAAETYLDDGGWDGSLTEAVIIEVEAPEFDLLEINIDPSWPNPEDYANVLRYPVDPDNDDARWRPVMRILDEALPDPYP